MKYVALGILALLFSPLAYADGSPVIYSKTILKIVPATTGPTSNNTQKDAAVKKPAPEPEPAARQTKEFTVEVRPLAFLSQRDYIAHTAFTDDTGLLILIEPTEIAELHASNSLGNVDVLFATSDGKILKIAPNLALPSLEEPISSETPVRAFVFLKAGASKASDIQPGDHIENALFKAHPVILDSASPTAQNPAQQTAAPVGSVTPAELPAQLPHTPVPATIQVNPRAGSNTDNTIQTIESPTHSPMIIPALQPDSEAIQNSTASPQR